MLFGVALILAGIMWIFVCSKILNIYFKKHAPKFLNLFEHCIDTEEKRNLVAFGTMHGIIPKWLKYVAYPTPVFIALGMIIILSKLLL